MSSYDDGKVSERKNKKGIAIKRRYRGGRATSAGAWGCCRHPWMLACHDRPSLTNSAVHDFGASYYFFRTFLTWYFYKQF